MIKKSVVLEFLDFLQEKDKEFVKDLEKDNKQYSTICHECGKNTATGLYPFWHRFARTLCNTCGEQYTKFLKFVCGE